MRVTLAMMLLAAIDGGCASRDAREVDPPSASDPMEQDLEFRRGLSRTLEATAAYGQPRVVTTVYRLGYAAGRLEATEHRQERDAYARMTGCMGAAPLLLEVDGFDGHLDQCSAMQRKDLAEAKFRGAKYEAARLEVVRRIADNAGLMEPAVAALDVGYASGFNKPDPDMSSLDATVMNLVEGCLTHVRAYVPLEPRHIAFCRSRADDYRRAYVENSPK